MTRYERTRGACLREYRFKSASGARRFAGGEATHEIVRHLFLDDQILTGNELYLRRQVDILEGREGSVRANVGLGLEYLVTVRWSGSEFITACQCLTSASMHGACEHVWATILAGEVEGYLQLGIDEAAEYEWDGDEDADESRMLEDLSSAALDGLGKHDRATFETLAKQLIEGYKATGKLTRPAPPPAVKKERDTWTDWLGWVRGHAVEEIEERKVQARRKHRRISYSMDLEASRGLSAMVVFFVQQRLNQSGEWGKPHPYNLCSASLDDLVDQNDVPAVSMAKALALTGRGSYYFGSLDHIQINSSELALTLLPPLCQTGRFRLDVRDDGSRQKPLLLKWDEGDPWRFAVTMSRGQSSWVLDGVLTRGTERIPLSTPWILFNWGIFIVEDRVARYEHDGTFSWIRQLRSSGPVEVPLGAQEKLVDEILDLPGSIPVDWPEELRPEIAITTPKPRLKVLAPPEPRRQLFRLHVVQQPSYLNARASFSYGGQIVDEDDSRHRVREGGSRRAHARDRTAEEAALAALRENHFRRKARNSRSSDEPDETGWEIHPRYLSRAVAALVGAGWHVEADGKIYKRPASLKMSVKSGIDWFELDGAIDFEGTTMRLPELLAAIRKGAQTVVLGDGSVGMLPEEWLKRYGLLAAVSGHSDKAVRFNRNQAGLLDTLLADEPEVQLDEAFEKARSELRRFAGIAAVDAPPGFQGELRPYQRDGLGWIGFLREFGFGGCLADDMGLGKTIQVLALLLDRKRHRESPGTADPGPSIVVAPKSLVFNWRSEIKRFTPELRVLEHTGIDRKRSIEHFRGYDVVLTTYGTLRRDIEYLRDTTFDYLILDEAQAVKNSASESAKAVRMLRGQHRLALSGTPVQNHLGELWSLFEFLNPGMLGTASVFDSLSRSAKALDADAASLMSRALRPFILRRTKQQVAKDLPERTEQTLECELEGEQRRLYDELKTHYKVSLLKKVEQDGVKRSTFLILEALLRLRQAACHPGLIAKERAKEGSAKLELLVGQLAEIIDEGHKALVFSQFTSFLSIVRGRLDKDKIPYEYLDGKTRDREACVRRFQEDDTNKIFLISLKAGGLGLNLTAADYVFLLDPWWNPAVEAQAIDRTHRIGQTRHVIAYRLIARDTIEQKVLELQQTKKRLADAIITADNSLIRELTRDDLELLLS